MANPLTVGMAVQSYCFRNQRDNQAVAQMVRAIGLEAVEICAVHANFDDPASFASLISTYNSAGVRVASIGVERITPDHARVASRAAFLLQADAHFMSVDFGIDDLSASLRVAEAIAEEHGLKLGIHNHGGRHWLGNRAAVEWVLKQTSDRIGLYLDTAWALDAGEDPVEWARAVGNRLHGVHLKDFTFDRTGKHQDVVVGTGNLQVADFSRALSEIGFKGSLVLEYEGDPADPVPALTECVKRLQQIG